MSSAYETLRVTLRGDVAEVVLARPDRLNAIDRTMFEELIRLSEDLDRDDAVRAVVLTGEGRGFCAGLDLDDVSRLSGMSVPEFFRFQELAASAVAAIKRLPKPVVAAVNGPAAGGGLALALASDVRLAAPEARFGVAFIRLGISACDVGVSWLLPRVVGLGHASAMMLTGDLVGPEEALRIGLVNRVVGAGDLLGAAHELAARMTRNSPFALRMTKQALQDNVDAPSLEAAIDLENRNQVLCSRTEDMQEAVDAFLEKRAAPFAGR